MDLEMDKDRTRNIPGLEESHWIPILELLSFLCFLFYVFHLLDVLFFHYRFNML